MSYLIAMRKLIHCCQMFATAVQILLCCVMLTGHSFAAVDTRVEGYLRVGFTDPEWDNDTQTVSVSLAFCNSLGSELEVSCPTDVSSPLSLNVTKTDGTFRWVNSSSNVMRVPTGVTYHRAPDFQLISNESEQRLDVYAYQLFDGQEYESRVSFWILNWELGVLSKTAFTVLSPGVTEVTGDEGFRLLWKILFLLLGAAIFTSLALELSKRLR